MTQSQTKPKSDLVVLGDILKSELSPLYRTEAPAPTGTKMGDLVMYPMRGQKLVALTDEQYGKVLVQPHNCIINLDFVNVGDDDVGQLILQGDVYGIKYIGNLANITEVPSMTMVAPTPPRGNR